MLKQRSKFGTLTVIGEGLREPSKGRRYYVVRCRCGSVTERREDSIRKAISCGCQSSSRRHGLSHHPLYVVWENMKKRCLNPNRKNFKYYGGRGITICDRWLNDPEAFIRWAIRKGWQPGLKLDRRDNDGNYEPRNCRFVTQYDQVHNRGHSTVS